MASRHCGGKTLMLEMLITPTTKGAMALTAMKATKPNSWRKTSEMFFSDFFGGICLVDFQTKVNVQLIEGTIIFNS